MEKKFLLLQYNNSSKKVTFSENLTFNLISENIRVKFGITSFTLQYWDKDVEDYVDMEESSLEDIKDEKVIKVRVVCSINDDLQPSSSVSHHQVEVVETLPPIHGIVTDKEPPPSKNQGCKKASGDWKVQADHVLSKKKIWPRTYIFPSATCPRSLLLKLEREQPLERRDVSLLLDTLYNDVSLYEGGLYPSTERYAMLIDALLSSFPYLGKQGEEMTIQSVRVYWREKLKYKWGNQRKIRDRDLPEVQSRKRKSEHTEQPVTKVINLTWGLANFLPPPLPSEDDDSIADHNEWLQREYKKTAPCITAVDFKMKLTFSERRTDVVTNGLGMGDLLQKYPWLHQRRQLLAEFSRLGPNTTVQNMDDLFIDGISKKHESITSLARGRKMPKCQQEIYEEMLLLRIDTKRKYSSQCAAVLGLGTLFKEKLDQIIKVKGMVDNDHAIQLVAAEKITTTADGAFQVHLEGHQLFKCDTFLEAVSGLMAAIYSFNLAYPKECEKSFLFLQKVVLGLADDEHIDKRIVQVLAQINKENNK